MNLLTLSPAEFCNATAACLEGHEFALRHATMAEVWDACPRADWMFWITSKICKWPDDRTLRLYAVWCARHTPLGDGRVTGNLLTDPRSLAALEVAERYANGQATDAELYAAYLGARAACVASSSCYAVVTSRAAIEAVAYRAAAADAATCSTFVDACSSAYATARAAASFGYDVVAALRAQADQLRLMAPNPFRAKEGKP